MTSIPGNRRIHSRGVIPVPSFEEGGALAVEKIDDLITPSVPGSIASIAHTRNRGYPAPASHSLSRHAQVYLSLVILFKRTRGVAADASSLSSGIDQS